MCVGARNKKSGDCVDGRARGGEMYRENGITNNATGMLKFISHPVSYGSEVNSIVSNVV